jgi:ankyrin repeat protein/L-ascorbate metabolism protein UlaG (beta-lactamase superfamily)
MCRKRIVLVALLALCSFPAALLAGEIHDAATKGNLEAVKALLEKDPSLLNAPNSDEQGRAPIHLASLNNHADVVDFLLSKGAKVNLKESTYQLTPLHMAAWKGNTDVMRLLLDKGADLGAREKDNETPLFYAAVSKNLDAVKLLVSKGAKVDDRESNAGNTTLSLAIERTGDFEVSRYLIEHGADPLFKQERGVTLLHEACWRGKKDLIDLLINKGVPVDARTEDGVTPLQLACRAGNLEAVDALISKGADVNGRAQDGFFPLYAAVNHGYKDIVSGLLRAGANVDERREDTGRTPLHYAAMRGYGEIASALIEKGADTGVKDKAGRTPLFYAEKYGQQRVARILKKGNGGNGVAVKPLNGSPLLTKKLQAGDAIVADLEHSGWAVKTQNHFLIFDYVKPGNLPDEPFLSIGAINPSEIKDQNVIVFASHAHGDHYNPAIFDWKKDIPSINYVIGFEPQDKEGYAYIPPRVTQRIDGVEVTPIQSNGGGEGFFVVADGVRIWHPGDHANGTRDVSGPFPDEIDFLAERGMKADLVFTPVTGCEFGDRESVRKGAFYTIEKLSPRVIFPMHAGRAEQQYMDFAVAAREAGIRNLIRCAENPGDYFLVKANAGKLD